MILTGSQILKEWRDGVIQISPFEESQLNPNSYNVRLGRKIDRYCAATLDAAEPNAVEPFEMPDEGFVLEPNELYLGHTVERVGSDRHVPLLFGRSSVGRLGLFVEITAPIGDIGFLGQWTLMLSPVVPLKVYPGMQIGQIMFFESKGSISLYDGKYQASTGPRSSELWRGITKAALPAERTAFE